MELRETINVKNVSKAFSKKNVLENVNISFSQKEAIGIIGLNGAGKTTFLKMLCGIIYPDNGSISINGLSVQSQRTDVMKNLGALLNGSRNLYWRLSAWQNFVYFSGLKGVFGDQLLERGKKLFETFDLWEVKDQKVETLSNGMRQKLSIACILSHNPNVILLDEPMLGLDASSQEKLEDFLINACQEENKTIVIASHDQKTISKICTRIITVQNGSVRE
ncbi:MAG: ABC transporter ATP-binding protein [Candidatus Babeliales bacterium]|nr:ABC transporter ATP-binding protein [Candidatus Babeliales bacterium]